MDRDTIRDYMEKSDFSPIQADALSRLLEQTVTKDDLRLAVAELEKKMIAIKSDLEGSIHRVEANMSRWMITLLVALGGLITLFNYFLD